MTVAAEDLSAMRGSLLAFCYQLLGSPFDAEDVVQDTMERAWRSREVFDPAVASLSTWVFRIARNVCFDRLRQAPHRALPRDLRGPGIDVGAPLVAALDTPWLMPAPTSWWADSEPERAAAAAEGMRLAVTAVLQALPPRQRGVFILRDTLGHSAAETAAIFELSVAAVNSALQRARAAVRAGTSRPQPLRREMVERYARAIEQADVQTLAALVASDVVFEMPPVPQWSIGRDTYAAFMARLFAHRGTRWATRPISGNGQLGILLFLVTEAGPQPHTVQLFEANAVGTGIGHVIVYQDRRLFALFENNIAENR
ncbi:RNA polymerase sigma-70 factor (ECF subfamily) [Nakamurella sp. UYEF19]|uniref:RNA polymerase subunit sigma-70 n=1 Tax=Nakamurella sp. UYEF19 TaxID=1756392 RepID=UPI00339947B9